MTYIRTTGRHIRKRWRAEPRPECSSTKDLFEREMARTVKYMTSFDLTRVPDSIVAEWSKLTDCQLKKIAKNPDLKYGKGTEEKLLIYQLRNMHGFKMNLPGDIEFGCGTLLQSISHQKLFDGRCRSYADGKRKDSDHGMDAAVELLIDGVAYPVAGLAVGEPEIVSPEETD